MYSESLVSRWSRIVRIRDNHTCVMCKEAATSRRKMHAHHINRQVDHPEQAVNISNGVCLCERCHLQIVHSTHINHKQFMINFKRWVGRKANKAFAEKYQYKLTK